MWGYILRPGIDSAIDATAGRGGDASELARILFADFDRATSRSHLVCIDVQQEACDETLAAVKEVVPNEAMERIHVVHGSHAPLSTPPMNEASVALVAFNLGFLPASDKQVQTTSSTTLLALVDACNTLRVGGLLSVMTYPGSNAEEHDVVKGFLEGLALLSSKTQNWRHYVDNLEVRNTSSLKQNEDWRGVLARSLERVSEFRGQGTTWRVYEHRKLGWVDAPTLYTAIRIK